MSNMKEEFQAVLEDEKRFTKEMERNVLDRISTVQKPKRLSGIGFGVVAFLTVSLFFIMLLFEREAEPEVAKGDQEALLLEMFQADVNSLIEPLYYEIGFSEGNDAIVVSEPNAGTIETRYYVWEDGKWSEMSSTQLAFDDETNWTVGGETPMLLTGIFRKATPDHLFVNDEVVEFVQLSNGVDFLVTIVETDVNRVIVQYSDDSYERLAPKLLEEPNPIAMVEPEEGQFITPYKALTMTLGGEEYMEYPLVIDREIGKLERGDVVFVDNSVDSPYVSRIVALPGESVGIHNGTIIVNGKPLEANMGYAKVDGQFTFDGYLKQGETIQEENVKRTFNMEIEPYRLSDKQYALIGDNWLHGNFTILNHPKYIVGKVIGYDKNEAAKEWSEEERTIYDRFHQSHDVGLLRDLSPIQIARLYYFASFMGHDETVYHFYPTSPELKQWTLEEHLQFAKHDRELIGDQSSYNLKMAQQILQGTFIETEENRGYIEFYERTLGFQMVKSDDGIWRVSFMPLQ